MGSRGVEQREPRLWRREFVRSADLDRDVPADDDFRRNNFTDYFGRVFLEEHWDKLTYNSVISHFYAYSHDKTDSDPDDYEQRYQLEVFCAADGAKVVAEHDKKLWENWAWLNQHIRFVTVVSGREEGDKVVPEGPFQGADGSFTIFIVGSESPESSDRFMDATCWDGKVFRWYARDWMQEPGVPREEWHGGWVYQGASTDAFATDSYLGPFGGHVNGNLVMKELHRPWPHWQSSEFALCDKFPSWIQQTFAPQNTPWISGDSPFSKVTNAEELEKYIKAGIDAWTHSRFDADFKTKRAPKPNVTGVQRWMAHVLLTTSINIAVARSIGGLLNVPHDFVHNAELKQRQNDFQSWFPEEIEDMFVVKDQSKDTYNAAINDLKIALYHVLNGPPLTTAPVVDMKGGELGGGKDGPHMTEAILAAYGEGQVGTFTLLQPSYEDAVAVQYFTSKFPKPYQQTKVLTNNLFLALMLIDVCNPIFSWRRGVLLQYCPNTISFDQVNKKYDLEDRFVYNVRASPRYINDKDGSSPETEFLRNFDGLTKENNEQAIKDAFKAKITHYWTSVNARLQTKEGITDYLRLIQSKHRIYRPVPLNEFALTLPYMPNWTEKLPLEMTYEGKVQPMPNRGAKFFMEWLGPLMGPNPSVIPRGDAHDMDDNIVWTLGNDAPERSMTVDEKELVPCRRRQACPILRKNPGHGPKIDVSAIGREFLATTAMLDAMKLEPAENGVVLEPVEVACISEEESIAFEIMAEPTIAPCNEHGPSKIHNADTQAEKSHVLNLQRPAAYPMRVQKIALVDSGQMYGRRSASVGVTSHDWLSGRRR